jgi:hypothetical protein
MDESPKSRSSRGFGAVTLVPALITLTALTMTKHMLLSLLVCKLTLNNRQQQFKILMICHLTSSIQNIVSAFARSRPKALHAALFTSPQGPVLWMLNLDVCTQVESPPFKHRISCLAISMPKALTHAYTTLIRFILLIIESYHV